MSTARSVFGWADRPVGHSLRHWRRVGHGRNRKNVPLNRLSVSTGRLVPWPLTCPKPVRLLVERILAYQRWERELTGEKIAIG